MGALQTEHNLPAAEGLVGRLKNGRGGTTILPILVQCSGHFQIMLSTEYFEWRVCATVSLLQSSRYRNCHLIYGQDGAASFGMSCFIVVRYMMQ